jgi:hypothetical protein
VCRGAGEMTIRECKVVVGEAREHTTKSVSLRETEETANERRGCCLARTRRALLLLLKAIGASLEAIVSVDDCGLVVCGLRCDFESRIDDRLACMVNASANHKPPLYLVVHDFPKLSHLHSGLNALKIYM